jgi:hypothetical protein
MTRSEAAEHARDYKEYHRDQAMEAGEIRPDPGPGMLDQLREQANQGGQRASRALPKLSQARVPGTNAQVGSVPVVGSAVQSFEGAHWVYQLIAILVIIYVGLALMAKFTGRSYKLGWGGFGTGQGPANTQWGQPTASAGVPQTINATSGPAQAGAASSATSSAGSSGQMFIAGGPGTDVLRAGALGLNGQAAHLNRMAAWNPARTALS